MVIVYYLEQLHGHCVLFRTATWPLCTNLNGYIAIVYYLERQHGHCVLIRTATWPLCTTVDSHCLEFG